MNESPTENSWNTLVTKHFAALKTKTPSRHEAPGPPSEMRFESKLVFTVGGPVEKIIEAQGGKVTVRLLWVCRACAVVIALLTIGVCRGCY